MALRVTVIICTRNRPASLAACLDALASQDLHDYDILVVDNGTTEATADLCRARGIACVREPVAGLTRARNLGARAAQGELVAYIDDDAIAEPSWLSAMAREFSDPRVAAVAGRTRYVRADARTMQMSGDDADGEVAPRPYQKFDRTQRDWFVQACFGGIGDGNTMMFRRSLLVSSIRFDERIGRGRAIDGGDEHVAFMSMIADGHVVVRTPLAVVRHPVVWAPAARRLKRIRDLRGAIAYVLFLLAQFPGHRAEIARYLAVRRFGRVARVTSRATEGLSIVDVVRAIAGGIIAYAAASREWSARPTAEPLPRGVSIR